MRNWTKVGSLRTLAAAVMVTVCAPMASHAEMVGWGGSGPLTVFESSALVDGKQKSKTAFSIPFAGLVTIKLTDLEWPARLASLSFRLADACRDTLLSFKVPGTFTFELDEPGKFFASINAKTLGEDLGRYSLQISVTPSAVPLPAAGLLLLSGLGGLAALRRRRQH